MNSDVLSVKENSKASKNRFRSYNANQRIEIMRREREKKKRTRDILFDESLSSRHCIEILCSLFLSFALYISECTISPK